MSPWRWTRPGWSSRDRASIAPDRSVKVTSKADPGCGEVATPAAEIEDLGHRRAVGGQQSRDVGPSSAYSSAGEISAHHDANSP